MNELIYGENQKLVKRYLKPLLYNLNPVFTDMDYIVMETNDPKNIEPTVMEAVYITREDGKKIAVDVTGMSKNHITMAVLNEAFRDFEWVGKKPPA